MAMGNGVPAFRVVTPEDVRAQLKTWGRLAAQAGLFQAYLADLKHLDLRLSRRPKAFGDPLHDYHGAHLCLYRGLTEFFIVTYAVHTSRPLVFVRSIRLRPDRALGVIP